MAKKSRKAAAKYSELSKAGKKRQRDSRRQIESGTAISAGAQDMADSSSMGGRVTDTIAKAQTISKPQPILKRSAGSYQHINADLKRTGTLAAVGVLILIVLSFVID